MQNWSRTDKFILTSATLLLIAFSYFLYDDSLLFPRNDTSGLEPVGVMSTSVNDVRLKNATAFSWFPAGTNEKVHQQDSVFTGPSSEATVRLNDGTVLSLKENSLVTLNLSDGQMTLNLRYGDFVGQIAGESSLKVQAGEKSFDLKSEGGDGQSSVRINLSSSGDVDLKLLEGQVKVQVKEKSGRKTEQKLNKDKSLAVSRKGEVEQLAKPKLSFETPDRVQIIRLKPNDAFTLKWTSDRPLSAYEVDLCRDPACEDKLFSLPATDTKLPVTEALADGPYHWRVRGIDQFGKEATRSGTQGFSLALAAPPVITTPGGAEMTVQAEIQLKKPDEIAETEARLSWETRPLYEKYPWQIARDPEFQELVFEGEHADGELTTPKLPSGIYHYRVSGRLKSGQTSDWSVSQFKMDLQGKAIEKPAAPKLLTRKIEFDPVAEKGRNPAAVPAPVVKWSKVPRAETYQLQLSKTSNFSGPTTYSVKTDSLSWTQYKPGTWHIRVFAVDGNGLLSAPSEAGTLTVLVSALTLNPVQKLVVRGEEKGEKIPPGRIKLEWNEIAFATKYQIEVSGSENFDEPEIIDVAGSEAAVTVPKPGVYHFRLRAYDANGNPVGNISNIEKGQYQYKNPMEFPKLMEPFDKASIFLQSTYEPFIWLEWRKVKDVGRYEVEVALDPKFKKRLLSFRTTDNRYLLRQKVPVGRVYWRVRALVEDEDLSSDWSPPREFNVVSKKNEAMDR